MVARGRDIVATGNIRRTGNGWRFSLVCIPAVTLGNGDSGEGFFIPVTLL